MRGVAAASADFPAFLFVIEADPLAMRADSRHYLDFAMVAREAVGAIDGQAADSWVGSDGDLYRRRRADYAPTLTQAGTAFQSFAEAVGTAASDIEDKRTAMTRLGAQARETWQRLRTAQQVADAATQQTHPGVLGGITGLFAPASPQDQRVTALEYEWEALLRKAALLRDEVRVIGADFTRVIDAIPPPPSSLRVPSGTSLADAAAWPENLMPAAVTSRVVRSVDASLSYGIGGGTGGIRSEIEALENGEFIVRVIKQATGELGAGTDDLLPGVERIDPGFSGTVGDTPVIQKPGGELSGSGRSEMGVVKRVGSLTEAKLFIGWATVTSAAGVTPQAWNLASGADGHLVTVGGQADIEAGVAAGGYGAGVNADGGVATTVERWDDGSGSVAAVGAWGAGAWATARHPVTGRPAEVAGTREKSRTATLRWNADGAWSMSLATRKTTANGSTETTATTRLTPGEMAAAKKVAMAPPIKGIVNPPPEVESVVHRLASAKPDSEGVREGSVAYTEEVYEVDGRTHGGEASAANIGAGAQFSVDEEHLVSRNGAAVSAPAR